MDDHDIRRLRATLGRRERGRGKRYTASLRNEIGRTAVELRRSGRSWQAIGRLLGIPHETVRRFSGQATATPFVPVEVVEEAPSRGGLVLVSPEGYRLEGLGIDEAAAILRRLR